jgi:hypothetical protein
MQQADVQIQFANYGRVGWSVRTVRVDNNQEGSNIGCELLQSQPAQRPGPWTRHAACGLRLSRSGPKCPWKLEPLSLIAILSTKSTRIYQKAGCWNNISGNKEPAVSPASPSGLWKTAPKSTKTVHPVRIHSPPVVERKRNIAIAQDEEVNRHRNVLSRLPGRRSPATRDNPPSRKSATRTCRS